MTVNEIKKTVEEYKNQITILQTEINLIQESCNHEETEVRSISNSVMDLRMVCKACSMPLGYPTTKELKNAGYF